MRRLRVAAGCAALLAVCVVVLSKEARTGGARAGLSSSAVSGYVVSDVHYELAADPTRITGVTFVLDAEPEGEVRARLTEGAAWATCRVAAARATCALVAPVSVRDVDRLDVVASA